ncbi:MAG: hypothetical protein OXC29_15670 [Rhodococcus sp.]|nr:hypothetical protein [Rhodococcus sp. (in: high G+C Gram-positive bacteria)]
MADLDRPSSARLVAAVEDRVAQSVGSERLNALMAAFAALALLLSAVGVYSIAAHVAAQRRYRGARRASRRSLVRPLRLLGCLGCDRVAHGRHDVGASPVLAGSNPMARSAPQRHVVVFTEVVSELEPDDEVCHVFSADRYDAGAFRRVRQMLKVVVPRRSAELYIELRNWCDKQLRPLGDWLLRFCWSEREHHDDGAESR